MDYFSLFQLPAEYQIDNKQLALRYQELQRQCHPDRFASSSVTEQLLAVQQAAMVNDAYHTLKDPLRRAEYIVSQNGINTREDKQTVNDIEFLIEQLELREELEEIEEKVDNERLQDLINRVTNKIKLYYQQLENDLNRNNWPAAADVINKLLFLNRLSQQIENLEDKWLDGV